MQTYPDCIRRVESLVKNTNVNPGKSSDPPALPTETGTALKPSSSWHCTTSGGGSLSSSDGFSCAGLASDHSGDSVSGHSERADQWPMASEV